MTHTLPFVPERCGSLYNHAKSSVFGFCSDYNGTLVALSIQASNTSIEQIHYALQGQEANITLQVERTVDGNSRSAYSRKDHFTVLKTPVPDTNEVSMLMINDSIKRPVKDAVWTHVWYRDDESFKVELFHRIREIVYIPVLEKWSGYLYQKGMITNASFRRHPMCGIFTKRPVNAWMTAGFSVGYIYNDRDAWEQLITAGLKSKAIEI